MQVLIYEENNYDSHGIIFVASSVDAALKKLIERQEDQVAFWSHMLGVPNKTDSKYEQHTNTFSVNIQKQTEKLDKLKEYIASQEWNNENILEFEIEPHFYFNWHEVL